MVFVCGILKDGVLYVIDSKFYTTSAGVEKRCKYLNKHNENKWIVLYQDIWKPYKD